MNDHDPSNSLADNQCVSAVNVEFFTSLLGERRRGSTALTIPAALSAEAMVSFLYRHLPTTTEVDAELWALGATVGASLTLQRKDTSWHSVTISDTATNTGTYPFEWSGQTIHGKLFVGYKSNKDRLHVWDGTSLRRAGLAPPTAAPTAADTGVGTFANTRYYRVRETVQAAGVTLRRSEPSPVLTKAPSGTGTGLIVTKPADMGENATHWELEASLDNVNFYILATTVVGTTTVTDSTSAVTGYTAFVLSADIGDYTVIPSGKFLSVDQDRLMIGGSWDQSALSSRVSWTPVFGDPGSGNDERIPIATSQFLDLDTFEGGELTGLSSTIDGSIYAFKWSHIYKLTSTGLRDQAYNAKALTKQRGALPGSLVDGVDQAGRPCLYFLDPKVGPHRVGPAGVSYAGQDIRETWRRVNVDATQVVSRGIFYPDSNQVRWCVAVDGSNTPNFEIVLQVNETQDTQDGVRRGFTTFTGPSTNVLATCLFSTNVESGIARNLALKPVIGVSATGHIQMIDGGPAGTATDDNGTAYSAHIVSKPYTLAALTNRFGIRAGALLAKADAAATVTVKLTRDYGIESASVDVNFAPTGTEATVIKQIDNLALSELYTVQVEFVDPAIPGARWELNELDITPRAEEGN